MYVRFEYNRERDAWCLLNKGKSSNNSPTPTSVYQELVTQAGETPTPKDAELFIENYIKQNNLNPEVWKKDCELRFILLADEFQAAAEKVFGVSLDKELTAYLTVNTRCPYSIEEGYFFVSMSKPHPLLTVLHELWHFYTWERFGESELTTIGTEKYNEIKEALTVLLNVECANLLPEGVVDKGYPQHQELREKILGWWKENPNIQYVWEKAKS